MFHKPTFYCHISHLKAQIHSRIPAYIAADKPPKNDYMKS